MPCVGKCGSKTDANPPRRRRSSTVNRSRPREKGARGYDAGKKIKGRKRHLIVDTLGLLLVVVHAADIPDRDGARLALDKMRGRFSRLKLIWADGGYAGQFVDWAKRTCRRVIEVVQKTQPHRFVVLPKRWIVERTFAWLGRYRRLSKDYETLTQGSESIIYLAMIHLMVRRLQPRAA